MIYVETATELEEKWICPNCGTEMNRSPDSSVNVYVCPECGCSIDAEKQNFEPAPICPNCNQPLEDNECPHCGYDLGSDFA